MFRANHSARAMARVLLLLACGLALAAAPAAAAPLGANVFGGYYSGDVKDPLIGGGLLISLATLTINPSIEYIFDDTYSLNADLHWNVLPLPMAAVWVGGGLGRWSIDSGADKETVVNVLAGAGLGAVPLKPYAQLKYVIVSDMADPLAITAGIRF